MRRSPLRPIALVLAALAAAACASVDATRHLAAAEVAIEGARAAGADRQAVYEFTAADAYYQKAREENARARYGAAAEHARKATVLAEEAQVKARQAARPEVR